MFDLSFLMFSSFSPGNSRDFKQIMPQFLRATYFSVCFPLLLFDATYAVALKGMLKFCRRIYVRCVLV
jgi:hypothetical protein